MLESHRLPAEPDSPLMMDDFDAFLAWRLEHFDELLAEKAGQRRAPAPSPSPTRLRALDAASRQVELGLRRLFSERLSGRATVPPQSSRKSASGSTTASRKQPALVQREPGISPSQLQYFDLRELQDTIIAKPLWPQFADVFGDAKRSLLMRFGQLAELRNAIRHSREVTAVMRNDGEAAIGWFRRSWVEQRSPVKPAVAIASTAIDRHTAAGQLSDERAPAQRGGTAASTT